jgi:hypothetical protein
LRRNCKCDQKIGNWQQLGGLASDPLLAVVMLAMGTTSMTTGMGNTESGFTGFAFKNHVVTSFPPAAFHRPQGLMVAGQHLMAMGLFQVLLVMINQLREENHG